MLINFALGLFLSVSPLQSFAPTKLHVRVRAEQGVMVVVQVESDDYYRRTDYGNDGKMREFDYRDLPGGHYIIRVDAFDRYGKIVESNNRTFEVISNQ